MQNSLPSAVVPDVFATESAEAVPVLHDIFELLQDYAPTWYTEELHHRIESALGGMVLAPVS